MMEEKIDILTNDYGLDNLLSSIETPFSKVLALLEEEGYVEPYKFSSSVLEDHGIPEREIIELLLLKGLLNVDDYF